MQLVQTPSSCRVATQHNGIYELNGNPSIAFTFSANYSNFQTVGDLSMGMDGEFTWSGEGRSSACQIKLNYKVAPSTERVEVTGSICGESVSGIR